MNWFRSLQTSVRGRLVLLVVAVAAPTILLVVALVVQAYRNERDAVAQHTLSTTRALAAFIDRQIASKEALLRGLAVSGDLIRRDFMEFDTRARALVVGADEWIVLTDLEGQQLVNTRVPFGSMLPKQPFEGPFRTAILEGRTYVSDVTIGALTQTPVLHVTVPVFEGPQLRYTLSYAMLPAAFTRMLSVERVAPGATIAIVDRQGTIAARVPNGERYVGGKARPDIIEATATRAEGVHPSVTLEGARVLAAHSRAPISGWSVAIGVPYAALHASAQRMLWVGLGAAALLLALGLALASWIGRALVRSVDALVADTEAIGRGGVPAERPSGLAETDFIARAVLQTARRLQEREKDNAALNAALQAELAKQKAAEEPLLRLAAIVESSEDAIVGKNVEGIITSWNRGANQIFGYTAEEAIGTSIVRLLPPERQDEEPAILEKIRRGERVQDFETVRVRKDGRRVPISLTVSPMLDASGRVVGASTIARDITQRARAESQQQALYELAASVNRAGALPEICEAALTAMCRCQDTERAAILLCDAAGTMRFAAHRGLSPQYRAAVEGHSPWHPTDANPPQALWIDDVVRASIAPGLREAIEREGIRALAFVPLTYERRLLGKFMLYYDEPHSFSTAELRPVEAVASQVAFALERQRSAEALEALVDERTASLRQVVAQMEEFSYSVSHDLRAPVRAMRGYAEAIMEEQGANLDGNARQMLSRILINSARMDRLIQDLLTYSRISRREIKLEPVSLEKLVRDVLQQYPDMRPERADIEVQSPLPEVLAHEPSLTQVISNLLSNAVKFVARDARPRVRVRFEKDRARARLWVEDNGIGIKPEHQSRLFSMFERVHAEKHYDGTGIGLAIVRKAVERMNGTVGVESDGVSGSRFWVDLPLASLE